MDEQSIIRELQLGFEYSFRHEDWIAPLEEALDGMTSQEAQWKPEPEIKSVWEIVLHLAVWNENIIERIETGDPAKPSEGDWPEPTGLPGDKGWRHAQQRLWDALRAVHHYIGSHSLDSLAGSPYGLGDLLCRSTHNGYHIGQITKLREWYAKRSRS